jgi:hypothetical protein
MPSLLLAPLIVPIGDGLLIDTDLQSMNCNSTFDIVGKNESVNVDEKTTDD